jgi:hypothetical protein
MALVFMDRQGKEIYPYYRRMSHSSLSCLKNSGADSSTGSYSGQSPLVHSLSPGYSTCLLINTVLSLSLLIMVVSPFFVPSLGVVLEKGTSVSDKSEKRRKG